MTCTVQDIIDDIRQALNECKTVDQGGCSCNDRYGDDDIINAINLAINQIASLRGDLFTKDVNVTIPKDSCVVNICDAGCDGFVEFMHSEKDPCYSPKNKCLNRVGTTGHLINKCLAYKTDALDPSTVLFYHFDPKSPCSIKVERVDLSEKTEIVIKCFVYPDPVTKGSDELLEVLCEKFRTVIYHYAIFHLIDRDHRPNAAYINFAQLHRDSGSLMMSDIRNADREFYSRNYLGENIDDCH